MYISKFTSSTHLLSDLLDAFALCFSPPYDATKTEENHLQHIPYTFN